MFLNHRPLLVLLLFLAASPVDVVSRVLYSDVDSNPDGYPGNDTLPIDALQLDVNPLHILCPVCSLVQGLVGLLLGGVLGFVNVKQLAIFICSVILSTPIKIIVVPNLICAVVFELIFLIVNKAGSGLCPLLLLCPMPKQKAKPTKKPSAEEEYENHVMSIIENRDSANLSPQMEYLYSEILKQLPMDTIKLTGIDESARHVLRNFVAAIDYHLAHRDYYLSIVSQKDN